MTGWLPYNFYPYLNVVFWTIMSTIVTSRPSRCRTILSPQGWPRSHSHKPHSFTLTASIFLYMCTLLSFKERSIKRMILKIWVFFHFCFSVLLLLSIIFWIFLQIFAWIIIYMFCCWIFGCTTVCQAIYLLKDICVFPLVFEILPIQMLCTFVNRFLCEHKFSFFWDRCPGWQLLVCIVVAC
jgi:hypothetical protein